MSHSMKMYKKKWITNTKEITNMKILHKMGFTLGEKIGKGTYSTVCVATHKYNDVLYKCACKIINKSNAEAEFIRRFLPRELQIITRLKHPHIVSVSNIIEIHNVIYVFMDYCRNGDLLEYVRNNGPLSEHRAKNYFRQIVDAVAYLHKLSLAHRDLKCENILLTINNTLKLGDFGFARSCVNKVGKKLLSSTFCGSAAYAAPEILKGIPYDPKMYDIWALGCVLYIIMTATMPFDDSNIKKMIKAQVERTACYHNIWVVIKLSSNALIVLLDKLLEPDARKRATIKDVLRSKWLQDEDSKPLLFSKCHTSKNY